MPAKIANPSAPVTLADLCYRGDGTFAVNRQHAAFDSDTWLSPREVAGIVKQSPSFVYVRLLDESVPMLVSRRPARKKILVSGASLDRYRRAVRNPAWLTSPIVRNTLLAENRAAQAALASPN
jgi:hypothetical protein